MKKYVLLIILASAILAKLTMAQSKTDGIKVGDRLPEFTLLDDNNQDFSPSNLVGEKYLVIYFYPKDDTPGCTKEACSFRDNFQEFEDLNVAIIGISSDDVKSHQAFKEKYNLPYTFLADTKGEVRKIFGVPKSYLGLIPGRVTYVFDKMGICVLIINTQTNPKKHITESLEKVKELEG